MDKATANTGCANTPDAVNHPAHYTAGGIECIDAITAALSCQKDPTAAWLTGQVIKYLWRWPLKNGAEDLQKAAWYLNRLIRHEQTIDLPERDRCCAPQSPINQEYYCTCNQESYRTYEE